MCLHNPYWGAKLASFAYPISCNIKVWHDQTRLVSYSDLFIWHRFFTLFSNIYMHIKEASLPVEYTNLQ